MLYLTICPSGGGKTTWSKEFILTNPEVVRLSTDECRAIISGSEENQDCNPKVFSTLFITAEHLLRQGYDVLIDACSHTRKNRGEFINIAQKCGVKVRAYIFNTPYEVCIARNEARERKVPTNIIRKQFDRLELPTLDEVDEIFHV